MKKEACFELGIISRLYSFKGEVILFIDSDEPDKYYETESVFLEINKQLTPFFIEKALVNKAKELRVRFEGIETEEQAKKIIKKKVFLPLEMLPTLGDNQFYFHDIEGYDVIDVSKGKVGTITTVIENPGNTLLQIDVKGVEAFIPLNDHTFVEVNKEKKSMTLNIPEGLIEIYTN